MKEVPSLHPDTPLSSEKGILIPALEPRLKGVRVEAPLQNL